MDLDNAIEVDFEYLLKETDKAYQIRFSPISIEWIPKSQCRILGNIKTDKTIYIARWLALEKGLVD